MNIIKWAIGRLRSVATNPTTAVEGDIVYNTTTHKAQLATSVNTFVDVATGAGGITIGTTAITGGTGGRLLYETSGNKVGEVTITSDGTNLVQTSNSATALVSGQNGLTNPGFAVDMSTASQKDGIKITPGASQAGTTIAATSDGADSGLTLKVKGNGKKVTITSDTSGGYSNPVFDVQESDGTNLFQVRRGNADVIVGSGGYNTAAGNDLFTASGGLKLAETNEVAWSINQQYNGQDLWIGKAAAANLRIGRTAAASPVAQTLSVQNVAAGTSNTAGAPLTVAGSQSTGTGLPGRVSLQTSGLSATSATTQNALVSRLELGATKLLVNNTDTAIVNATVASNTVASGIVDYTVEVFDGTELQVETGSFIYQVTNKGGTIANNTITFPTGFPKKVTTGGTLTVTWSITAANPAVLTLNANSSLTPSANYPRVTYAIRNLTQQAIAVQ